MPRQEKTAVGTRYARVLFAGCAAVLAATRLRRLVRQWGPVAIGATFTLNPKQMITSP